jgi:hypothetical protein
MLPIYFTSTLAEMLQHCEIEPVLFKDKPKVQLGVADPSTNDLQHVEYSRSIGFLYIRKLSAQCGICVSVPLCTMQQELLTRLVNNAVLTALHFPLYER